MSRLVLPQELSREVLVGIVSKVQGRLYLDLDERGTEFWNPGKEWSCCDVCQDVQDMLHEHGLVPGDEQAYEEAVSTPQGNSIRSLVEWAESKGVGSEDLDELVHDCASSMASDANNAGLDGQIEFLVKHLGESGATAQLAEIVGSSDGLQEMQERFGECTGPPRRPSDNDVARTTKYLLYDFDAVELATTTVYDTYEEAKDDATEFDNVIVMPLIFEEER